MTPSDKPRFTAVLKALADGLGAPPLSKTQYAFYWAALEPLTIDQIEAYAVRLARELKWLPKPSEFFDLAKAEHNVTWAASWAEILERHGETADPIGQRALRNLGGWRVVGFVNTERLPWLAEKFREHYESIADGTPVQQRLERAASAARIEGPRKALT